MENTENLEKSQNMYRKAARCIQRYAKTFGYDMSDAEKKNLIVLFKIMRYVDFENDTIINDSVRIRFQREILQTLVYGGRPVKFSEKIEQLVDPLLKILNEKGVRVEFAQTVAEIFNYSNAIRKAESVRELFRLTAGEGETTAKMVLLLLDTKSPKYFKSFVKHLGRIGNIIDTLFDLKEDRDRDEIQISPTFAVYMSYTTKALREIALCMNQVWRRPQLIPYLVMNIFDTQKSYSTRLSN